MKGWTGAVVFQRVHVVGAYKAKAVFGKLDLFPVDYVNDFPVKDE